MEIKIGGSKYKATYKATKCPRCKCGYLEMTDWYNNKGLAYIYKCLHCRSRFEEIK